MVPSVRFIAVMTVATVIANTPLAARATSDTVTRLGAPHWLDQTVYRPACRNIERACGCHVDSYGEPDCGRW